MELLSTNDSSFTGFHLLFSIIWKLEWRPGPSFVSQGKMVFVPTAEVSPLPHVCIWSKVHHKTVLPSSQEDYWCFFYNLFTHSFSLQTYVAYYVEHILGSLHNQITIIVTSTVFYIILHHFNIMFGDTFMIYISVLYFTCLQRYTFCC